MPFKVLPWFLWWKFSIRDEGISTLIFHQTCAHLFGRNVIWHDMTCCDKMSWMSKMPRRFHELEFNHHFGSYHACINFDKSSSFLRRWELKQSWTPTAQHEPKAPDMQVAGCKVLGGPKTRDDWDVLCPYGSSFWILMLIRVPIIQEHIVKLYTHIIDLHQIHTCQYIYIYIIHTYTL